MYTAEKYRVTGRGDLELIRIIEITEDQYLTAIHVDLPYEQLAYIYKIKKGKEVIAELGSYNPDLFD